MNKEGQIFQSLLTFSILFVMVILGSPILSDIIVESTASMGSATAFLVRAILWLLLIVVIAFLLAAVSSGEGFFFGG